MNELAIAAIVYSDDVYPDRIIARAIEPLRAAGLPLIPVLVGVPARNLDRWRAFAGSLAVELPATVGAISDWLALHSLPSTTADASAAAQVRAA